MKRLFWWLFVVRISLRWIPRLNLGRYVWYRGEKWMLIQGAGSPYWDLIRDGKCEKRVHEKDFRAVQNPVEWSRAFRSGYRFYMGYWYRIWLNEGIKAWMMGCNIWARKRKEPK